jgi:ketosteroid isomerase-like protein
MPEAAMETAIAAFHDQLAHLERGDLDGMLALDHPEIVIVTRDPEVAIVGEWRGPEGHRRLMLEWVDAWEEVAYTLEEIVPVGERFVAIVLYRGRGKGSGAYVEGRFAWLCEYDEGLLRRWETFSDREQALSVARRA